MVVNAKDLKRDFMLSTDNIEEMKSTRRLYSFVNSKRDSRYQSQVASRTERVNEIEGKHYRTLACKDAMLQGCQNRKEILSFFASLNGVPSAGQAFGNANRASLRAKRRLAMEQHKRAEQRRRQSAKDQLAIEASKEDQTRTTVRERVRRDGATHFDVLGLNPDATLAEINSAFRHLSRYFHPDRCKDEDATEIFRSLKEAQEKLKATFRSEEESSHCDEDEQDPPSDAE